MSFGMKIKLASIICAVTFLWVTAAPAQTSGKYDPVEVTADVLIVRPVALVATAAGSAIWVVALPISAISKSVKSSYKALVVKPARATFTRQLGDMEALSD
jgi:hypothetical protein